MSSPDMWRRVDLVRTAVSEEAIASNKNDYQKQKINVFAE
jgi:hypothetical protein